VALAAVEKSDAFINDKVGRSFTTKTKKDGSFVTNVDNGVEQLIRRLLRKTCPDHDITGGGTRQYHKGLRLPMVHRPN
jgi:fructose-1,6-bisphosphatase/inositol monophosphatase family enzyme